MPRPTELEGFALGVLATDALGCGLTEGRGFGRRPCGVVSVATDAAEAAPASALTGLADSAALASGDADGDAPLGTELEESDEAPLGIVLTMPLPDDASSLDFAR